jgi:hypothetical protein
VGPGPDALYEAFNRCDLLVADVSSVVADFLASGKPYVVTNLYDADPAELITSMPSTSGGRIVGPTVAGLVQAVAEVTTGDPLRDRRAELATYFLGEREADPIARFAERVGEAVDAATVWADARRLRLAEVAGP